MTNSLLGQNNFITDKIQRFFVKYNLNHRETITTEQSSQEEDDVFMVYTIYFPVIDIWQTADKGRSNG